MRDKRVRGSSLLGDRRYAHSKLGTAVLALVAAVAVLPMLLHRPFCGDDLQFHALSWFDAQQSWRQGRLYPHWSPSANYGAGEARFVFYPPVTWMLGAALGLVLPWSWVPVAMVFLMFFAAGLAVRALARTVLEEMPATLAAMAAVLCVYPLFTAYDRAAFGELAGGCLIPLALLLALRGREARGATLKLALVVAGCWLCDAPVGVMGTYLLIAVAVAAAVMARAWFPVVRTVAATALGLGLAAVYWVPSAWEQRWVDIREAVGVGDPGLSFENNWLFGGSTPPMPAHDAGLRYVSQLAVAVIAVTVVSAVVVFWRHRRGVREWMETSEGRATHEGRSWVVLAGMPLVVLLLLLPVSRLVWEVVPKLRYLQFPWRWVMVLEAPMGILLAGAVWPGRAGRWAKVVTAGVFCAMLAPGLLYANATLFGRGCDADEIPGLLVDRLRAGTGSWGADEYAPLLDDGRGTDDTMVATGLPDVCFVNRPDVLLGVGARNGDDNPQWSAAQGSCVATASAKVRTAERLRVSVLSPGDGWAVVKLRRFPAWRVIVNGREVGTMPEREDGLMVVPVAAGGFDLRVDWMTTWDVWVGRLVSGVSVVLLVGFWWWGRNADSLPTPTGK